jgi:ureidoacrylate peracid hydrolase
MSSAGLSREVPIDPAHAALLFIDVQNYTARPDGGEYASLTAAEREARYGWFFHALRDTAVPNMQRLQAACRLAKIEVLYTVIEALTRDGRDLSLDYKISGLFVPRGSWDAKVLDAIAPAGDEIVLPKTSSSVFISTNIDYVLRNLSAKSLIVAGVLTDQCIDSAVRDACDLGYLVTVPTDACATLSRSGTTGRCATIEGTAGK